jgi:glutamine synthetase adenylyltransferase
MARPGTVVSSLPVTDDDDPNLTPDDQYDELNEEDFDDPAEAAAVSEGYASLAEKETMEAQAHGQGWRPLSEYRGSPGKWKTAKKFLEDGQNYLPFVQKENREQKQTMAGMTTEMEGLRTEMATTRADMNKLLAYSRNANQAGYERAVKDLKAQQRQAVAEGDTAKFDQIEGQLGEMADARAEAAPDAQAGAVAHERAQPRPPRTRAA